MPQPAAPIEVVSGAGRAPADLAVLISAFNEVTTRLQGTHEMLRGEVVRLEAELREAREQLGRARELAALGEMAAGIAHEVRNPLGSIRLYASVLTQDLGDRPAERAVASKISSAVSRLDAVVGDVLAFARPLVVKRERVAATTLLRDAADACADLWARHSIDVRVSPGARRDVIVDCDPALMHQALVNVMRNAAEAMAESAGSEPRVVWLGAGNRRAADAEGNRESMSVLSVRDSGPGIPEGTMGRMFNPFFTTRHTGTGLGLAIVHRILDAHAGRIIVRNNNARGSDANSAPARGASVEFLVPASAGAAGVSGDDKREAA